VEHLSGASLYGSPLDLAASIWLVLAGTNTLAFGASVTKKQWLKTLKTGVDLIKLFWSKINYSSCKLDLFRALIEHLPLVK